MAFLIFLKVVMVIIIMIIVTIIMIFVTIIMLFVTIIMIIIANMFSSFLLFFLLVLTIPYFYINCHCKN